MFDKYTSHQWNGSGVTDYLISPNTFANKLSKFSVGAYVPWLSDHCPIYATILLNEIAYKTEKVHTKLSKLTPTFMLCEKSRNTFILGLKSHTVEEKINQLINTNEQSATKKATEIQNILLQNAQICKIKKRKLTSKDNEASQPWFDNDCKSIKNELRELGNVIKKSHLMLMHAQNCYLEKEH